MIENNALKTKSFSLLVAFTVLVEAFGQNEKTPRKESGVYGAVKLSTSLDLVDAKTNKMFTFRDSVFIFKMSDIFVYKVPYTENSAGFVVDHAGNIIKQRYDRNSVKYNFFIYRQSDSIGLHFDSLEAKTATSFNVDSFLVRKAQKGLQVIYESDSLASKEQVGNLTLEKYIPKIKMDASYPDSSYVYFDKIVSDMPYSFQKTIEAQKKMRIVKVQFIYNPTVDSISGMTMARRVFEFELSPYGDGDSAGINQLVVKFKKLYLLQ